MNLETVRLDVADFIATVTIDRPPGNAQNQKAREELIRVFDAISDRDDVRVAILTAAGKVFSAGADGKERVGLVEGPGDYIRNNPPRARIFLRSVGLRQAGDLRRERAGIR